MREITTHKKNPVNDQLDITVLDEPGAGGANHEYLINSPTHAVEAVISFQNGPIAEAGVNGITHEALLAILIDRLEAFQRGPYACDENEHALGNLLDAQANLAIRTYRRMARGVEGTHEV